MSYRLAIRSLPLKIWSGVSHLGIIPQMDMEQLRQVQTLNRLGLIGALFVLPFCLPALNPTRETFGWIEFVCFWGFGSVLLWHTLGWYRVAASIVIVTTNFKIFFSAAHRGLEAGEQLFFIPLVMGLLLLYSNRKEQPEKYALWGLTLLNLLGLELSHYQPFGFDQTFSAGVMRQIFSVNFSISAALIIAITHYYFRLAGKQQDQLKKSASQQKALNTQLEDHVEALSVRNEELKTQEKALIQAKDKAESAAKAKSEFLSVMSHELRTPLHAIIGSLDLLVDTSLTHEQTGYVETVRQGGENLFIILDNILSVSYGDKALLPPVQQEEVEVEKLLQAALMPFRVAARQKGIELRMGLQKSSPPTIVTDEKRILQVLRNLVSNAIKFTQQGHVSLSLYEEKGNTDSYWCFGVRDTGIGISQSLQQELFRPFVQQESYSHRRHEGAGIGLAVCFQLMQQIGGDLQVESEVGKGSFLTARIPQLSEASIPTDASPDSSFEPAEYFILVAEDNAINQKIATRLLKKLGYQFEVAANGKLAHEIVQEDRVDLVLMDMQMPEVNGLEATEKIRSETGLKKQPVIIAMTANASQADKDACLQAGMEDFLTKPVRKPDLEKMLAKWLMG